MPKDCCRLGACDGLSMPACVRARARACVRSRASRENGDSRTVGPSDVFSACFGSLSALQLRGSTCDRPSPRARRPASTRLDTSRAAPCPEVVPPSKPGPTSSGRVVAPEATLATRTCLRLRRRRLGLVSDLTARQRGVCDILCRLRRLRLVPQESSVGPFPRRRASAAARAARLVRNRAPVWSLVSGALCHGSARPASESALTLRDPGPAPMRAGRGSGLRCCSAPSPSGAPSLDAAFERTSVFGPDCSHAPVSERRSRRSEAAVLSGVFWWSGYGSGARSAQGRRLFAISMGPPPGVSKIVGTYINS